MKRKIFVILICIPFLLMISCSNSSLTIINKDIVNEVFYVPKLDKEYSIHLPIVTSQSIESIQLDELVGKNVDLIDCTLDFDNNSNTQKGNNYINSFSLNFKCEYGLPEILITDIKLVINSQQISYSIGNISIISNTEYDQSTDQLVFLSSPVTGFEFDGAYTWEAETRKNLKIRRIYTNSKIIDASYVWINDELLENPQNIDKIIEKKQTFEIHVEPQLNDLKYENSVVGFDLIIELEDLENNMIFIAKAPVIFRIYGCGEDFSKLIS